MPSNIAKHFFGVFWDNTSTEASILSKNEIGPSDKQFINI